MAKCPLLSFGAQFITRKVQMAKKSRWPKSSGDRRVQVAEQSNWAKSPARSIVSALQIFVFVEELKAGIPFNLSHIAFKFVSSSEDIVEFVVSKTYDAVVLYRAAVIDFVDICPHTGAQAHMARLAGRVQSAS